jgi:addiction module RelE/StbE family toxin
MRKEPRRSREQVVKAQEGGTRSPVIKWTEQATQQLDQAHDYIALSNSKEVAGRITMQIVTSVQQLTAFPMAARAGRVPGTRELVISNTPFIAAYAVEKADIVVLAVYQGAQRWPEGF